jgi:hypothetical protein
MEKCSLGCNFSNSTIRPDDFARGEVIPCLLAALLREAPEQFLVDVAHLQPGELVGAEREFLVLVQYRRQTVVLHHQTDRRPIVEVFDDVLDVLREPVDVGAEVLFKESVVLLVDQVQRPVGLVGKRSGGDLQAFDEFRQFLLGELRSLANTSARFFSANRSGRLQADDDDGQDYLHS